MDGWKMKFPFGESLFSGTMLVAGRVSPLKILTPGAVDLLLPCSRPKLTTSNIKNNSPKSNNDAHIWAFPKIGVPQNGWFIMENPVNWMIWGYRHFRKHQYRI